MTKSTHFTFSSTDGYSIEIKARKKKKKKNTEKTMAAGHGNGRLTYASRNLFLGCYYSRYCI